MLLAVLRKAKLGGLGTQIYKVGIKVKRKVQVLKPGQINFNVPETYG